MQRNNILSEYDHKRLEQLIARKWSEKDFDNVQKLKSGISNATVVSSEKIPGEIVTMNSRVVLEDLSSGSEFDFQIVFPSNANIEKGKISILAPMGTAVLGSKVGDTVDFVSPKGIRRLKIKKMLYQPESEGDWYI
ncbi:MAG: Regulator of nucleoside diphosphate kinase [Planctomycetes bacterium ADurb.Bin401]|nr:MAG: Regulator of nucleoside diphosphate kinase [Planctomycetes bacterium ADurb.Bin401]